MSFSRCLSAFTLLRPLIARSDRFRALGEWIVFEPGLPARYSLLVMLYRAPPIQMMPQRY